MNLRFDDCKSGNGRVRFRDYITSLLRSGYYPDSNKNEGYEFTQLFPSRFTYLRSETIINIGFMIDVFQFILHRMFNIGSYINTSIHSLRFNPVNKIFDFVYYRYNDTRVFSLGFDEFAFIIFFNFDNDTRDHGYTNEYDPMFKNFILDFNSKHKGVGV